jgi:hypothetical protein
MSVDRNFNWPQLPYMGLDSYGPADIPIFAARDLNVQNAAVMLTSGRTRTMIFHGGTGTGKSSLLRAGLIPKLETEGFSFEFLKEESSGALQTIFIDVEMYLW